MSFLRQEDRKETHGCLTLRAVKRLYSEAEVESMADIWKLVGSKKANAGIPLYQHGIYYTIGAVSVLTKVQVRETRQDQVLGCSLVARSSGCPGFPRLSEEEKEEKKYPDAKRLAFCTLD